MSRSPQSEPEHNAYRHWWQRRWLRLALVAILMLGAAGFAALEFMLHNAEPILRRRIVETLSARFGVPVELDRLQISFLRGVEVEGTGLRLPIAGAPGEPTPPHPMIAVRQFRFRTGLRSLLRQPMRISSVEVDGMSVHIPPPSQRAALFGFRKDRSPLDSGDPTVQLKVAMTVEALSCRDVRLSIESGEGGKEPLFVDIRSLLLRDVGPNQAMLFEAELVNPKPRGFLHAEGHFGPWAGKTPLDTGASDPGRTPLDGNYQLDNADLNTIRGLGGRLSSQGHFRGVLDRIAVAGTTDVPDFSLDITGRPMPLHTSFQAVVDGKSGDIALDRVQARLLHSEFTTSGKVVNLKGRGHDIDLNVDIPAGRIEDFLHLAVKTDPPVIDGTLALKARLHLPPGRERVPLKMEMNGSFELANVQFSKRQWQDTVDDLSVRATGRPEDVRTAGHIRGADTHSQMRAVFAIRRGVMSLTDLQYSIPGARALLNGVYSLDGKLFEFQGHVRTEATASQMVGGWKGWLLKPLDPYLKRNGAGVDLPVSVDGTGGEMHLGLALGGTESKPAEILKDVREKDRGRRELEAARAEAALADAEDRRAAAASSLEVAEAEHRAAVQHRAEARRRAAEALAPRK